MADAGFGKVHVKFVSPLARCRAGRSTFREAKRGVGGRDAAPLPKPARASSRSIAENLAQESAAEIPAGTANVT